MTTNTRDLVDVINAAADVDTSANQELNVIEASIPGNIAGAVKATSAGRAQKIVMIDPARIRPSRTNPRDAAKLTRENTAELREMILAVGQLNPGAVRALKGDPDHDYELVAGTRRLRCISDLRADGHELLFPALVLKIDDIEAAKIADAENRGRAEISEYERGIYLRHLLRTRFEGSQKRLAAEMNIDAPRLSRLLALASWEPDLLAAFGDPRLVRQQDVVEIQAVKSKAGTALLAAATELGRKQRHLEIDGKPYIEPAIVRRKLLAVAEGRKEAPAPDERLGGRMKVRTKTRNGVSVFVATTSSEEQAAIIGAIEAAVLGLLQA